MPESADYDDHRTLERLALAEWSASAAAEVVSSTVVGDRAEVRLLVNGDYEYWQYYQRLGGGWTETVTANAPCSAWDDPSVIHWLDEAEPPG